MNSIVFLFTTSKIKQFSTRSFWYFRCERAMYVSKTNNNDAYMSLVATVKGKCQWGGSSSVYTVRTQRSLLTAVTCIPIVDSP